MSCTSSTCILFLPSPSMYAMMSAICSLFTLCKGLTSAFALPIAFSILLLSYSTTLPSLLMIFIFLYLRLYIFSAYIMLQINQKNTKCCVKECLYTTTYCVANVNGFQPNIFKKFFSITSIRKKYTIKFFRDFEFRLSKQVILSFFAQVKRLEKFTHLYPKTLSLQLFFSEKEKNFFQNA